MTISLTGFMGAGKTSAGQALAEMLGWDFIDLDSCISHKKGMKVQEIITAEGEEAFRAVEAECLRDVIIMQELGGKDLVLALGGGTVTTGSIGHLIFGGTKCVWLQASLDTIRRRLGEDTSSRPLFSEELYRERIPFYEKAEYRVVTDGRTPEEVAAEISLLVCKE